MSSRAERPPAPEALPLEGGERRMIALEHHRHHARGVR